MAEIVDLDKAQKKYGKDAHGEEIVEGYYAVSPAQHIVMLPTTVPLKAGFRLATEDEVKNGHPHKASEDEAHAPPSAPHGDAPSASGSSEPTK